MPKEPERLPKKQAIEELEDWIPGIAGFGLTLKQLRFIAAYIGNDFNAVEAYHACNSTKRTTEPNTGGCTNRSAAKAGLKILKNEKVQKALTAYMKEFIGDNKNKLEYMLLEQLMAEATYRPSDIIDIKGNLIHEDLADYPPNLQRCIKKVEIQMHPKDPTITVTKVTLADRERARKELMTYINMLHTDSVTTLKIDETQKDKLRAILGDKPNSGFAPLPKHQRPVGQQLSGDK